MKDFYIQVLKYGTKIEWLGGDKYKLTWYHENGNKGWEGKFKGDKKYGKHINWFVTGNKFWEDYYWEGKRVSRQEYLSLSKSNKK